MTMQYLELLRRLHEELQPAGYLEIGVDWGDSLRLSRARSVAIDPAPKPRPESLLGKPGLILYVGTSDDFFREHTREALLRDAPLDLAFIDGLHEFAQVVRDLENVERWGHQGTVVAIHDVLPRNAWEAAPAFHDGFWTGDVWRIVPFLREHRPDLRLWVTEAEPTGLLIVTGFDPAHPGKAHLAEALDTEFPPAGPDYDRLAEAFIVEAIAEPAEDVLRALGAGRRLERAWDYTTKWGMRRVADTSWRPLLEAAAAWHHTPMHQQGLRACLRLIDGHWLPDDVRQQAYGHLTRYASPLAILWPGASRQTLALLGGGQQPMSSPSPAIVTGDLVVTVQTPAANRKGMTWSLLALDGDLRVLAATPLRDATRQGKDTPAAASSIDQMQPFVHEERLRAIITVCDRNLRGVAQTGLVSIDDGGLRDLRLLSDPANGRPERDWAPLLTEDGLHAVSWWEPTETLGIEPGSGTVSRTALRPAPRIAERFEGASSGVDVPGGWLFLVNERTETKDEGALVFARFVFLRHDFRVTAASPHFWVAARGQDAASGLTRQEDDLIAGFTSRGEEALLARIPLAVVLASLISIESAGSRVDGAGTV